MPKTAKPDRPTKLGFQRNANGVDTRAPLIYRLWLRPLGGDEVIFYVGLARNKERPYTRYDLNVRDFIAGKPPMNGSGESRPVIRDLVAAHKAGHHIGIELIRNVPDRAQIEDVEKEWQGFYGLRNKIRMLDDEARPLPDFLARRSAARALPVPPICDDPEIP